MDPGHRSLATVGAAYLVQGIVAGVGLLVLGVLVQLGTPLETQVGILASGALPWLLKFGVAAVLDLGPSWPLRVRGVVLSTLQGLVALGLWQLAHAWPAVAAGESGSVTTLGLTWVAINFATALQDTLVDGLALDTLEDRRASTGVVMGVGHALGFGLLGPVVISRRIGEAGMVAGLELPAWWVATLACAPLVLLWLPGRPERPRGRRTPLRERSKDELIHLAALPALYVALLFGAAATNAVGSEFIFAELGWDVPRYTSRLLPLAATIGIVGSLACGPLVAKQGPARAAILASLTLGLTWLGFAALSPWWARDATILVLSTFEGLAQYGLLVALHALALVFASRSPAPTTTFVLAMAALNLPRVVAPLAAPTLMVYGFVPFFVLCGTLQLLVSAGVWPLRQLETKDPSESSN